MLGSILIKLGIDESQNIVPLYTFEANKTDTYDVLLKPNNFYLTETLPSGLFYASKSINSFRINFKYNFKTNEKTNIDYNYSVTANLIGKANTNDNQIKEVWNRPFNLTEDTINSENEAEELEISKNIDIDYEKYNDLARSFEKTYGIAIDTVLKVRFNVNLNINHPNIEPNLLEDFIELEIPINNTVTEVRENYENTTYKEVLPQERKATTKEILYYLIGGGLIILSITIFFVVIRKNKNGKTPEDIYENNISRILKYYADLIVTVSNKPDLKNLQIMNVVKFNDLIDVAEQNKVNIIHYEVLEKEESDLYVIVDKYAYKYVVTIDELK